MKIDSYEISNNTIILHFDVSFKQVNYIKMESVSSIDNSGELECEEMEIKYSKKKNTLNLFINEQTNVIVVLITEMDKRGLCYSYYIHLEKGILEKSILEKSILEKSILEKGNFENSFSELDLPFQKILTTPFTNKESKYKIQSFEKNQNIFADIKRKDKQER
jgi:hypothetical protein